MPKKAMPIEEKRLKRKLYMRKLRQKHSIPCPVRTAAIETVCYDLNGDPIGCDRVFGSTYDAKRHGFNCTRLPEVLVPKKLLLLDEDTFACYKLVKAAIFSGMEGLRLRAFIKEKKLSSGPGKRGRKKRTDLVCELCGKRGFTTVHELHNHRRLKKVHRQKNEEAQGGSSA